MCKIFRYVFKQIVHKSWTFLTSSYNANDVVSRHYIKQPVIVVKFHNLADLQLYTHTQSMTQYSHVIGQFWVNPGLSLVEASVTDVTNMTHTRFRCLPCHPCPSSNHPGPGPGLTPLPPSTHLQTWILSHSRNWLPGWESVRNPHQSNLVEILLSYNSAIYTRQLLQHFQQHWNTLLNKGSLHLKK